MKQAPLRVQIGVLSVHGVSRAQGDRIGVAVHAELARLLGSETAAHQLRMRAEAGAIASVEHWNAGSLHLAPAARPERIGHQLAQRIGEHLMFSAGGEVEKSQAAQAQASPGPRR